MYLTLSLDLVFLSFVGGVLCVVSMIWTAGNRETDFVPEISETKAFKAYRKYRSSLVLDKESFRLHHCHFLLLVKRFYFDVVFAGHVHAYERSERISNIPYNVVNGLSTPVRDELEPVYITIGDGENQDGLVKEMMEPQPRYSAYREPSYGHGVFDIKNRTRAYFGWHRNQDAYAMEADSLWIRNLYWKSVDEISANAAYYDAWN